MPGRSIPIARIAGIPLGAHPLWLVIVALITWSLGASYYPERVAGIDPGLAYLLGLVSALLLFASIVAHEYGHAIVARGRGVEVEEIDLWLLGGVARFRGQARRPQDELAYAIAGPAVTLAVAVAFGAAALALRGTDLQVLRALVEYQAYVNAAILVFNLMPAFPLDGGRVLRAILWRRSGDPLKATRSAAAIGRVFGFALIGLGVLSLFAGALGGLWFAVIGMFIVGAAGAESLHAEAQEAFAGVPARDLMTGPPVCVPADATLGEAVTGALAPHPHPAFPVVRDGRVIGMLTVAAIEAVPAARRAGVRAEDVADRDPELLVREDADVAALIDLPAFGRVMRAAVVDADGRPVGVLSVTDVNRALQARRLVEDSGA